MKLHGRQGRGSSSWLCFTLLNPRTTTTLPLDFVAAARASGGWAGVSAADPQSPRSRKPAMGRFVHQEVQVAWDNFRINAGTISCDNPWWADDSPDWHTTATSQ